MGKIISIFLLAVLSISCEQEPFDEGVQIEVQNNPDEYKLFSQIYAETTDQTKYMYLLYKSQDDDITAEDKLIVAWSNFVDYATSVNMPITGEEFMNYASAYYDNEGNTINSYADVIVISDYQYATQQLRIQYQVDNTWDKFLIPYDINMFIDAGDEVIFINQQDVLDIVIVASKYGSYNQTTNVHTWIYIGYFKTFDGVTAEEKIANAYSIYQNSSMYNAEVDCEQWEAWLRSETSISPYNAQPDFYIYSTNNYLGECKSINAIPVETVWTEYNLETFYNNGDEVIIP